MSDNYWKVLIVDDEEDVHDVTTMALRRVVFEDKQLKLFHAYSASEAIQILIEEVDIAIGLIDVVMENDTSGLDLVKTIRSQMGNEAIRLILRTGNPGFAPEDSVILAYDINDYRVKTELTAQSLKTMIITALRSYKGIVTITCLNREIDDTQKELLFTLGEIAESRSYDINHHVERVGHITALLALKLGFDSEEAKLLKLAASMHDIGKIAIDDRILNKPGKLTKEEFEVIKKHSFFGREILKNSERKLLKTASIIAFEHHENYDGSGYPRGISGEDINLSSRIVALVDVYDALSIKRVYKDAWSKEAIYDFIREQDGIKFDPKIVKVFFDNLNEIEDVTKSLI